MPLRITMTQREASWCRHYSVIFRKRQKGRRLRRLGPRCLYSSAGQPLPAPWKSSWCALAAAPDCLGFWFNSDQGGGQVIGLRHLSLEPKAYCAWWVHHHSQDAKCLCCRFSVQPIRLRSQVPSGEFWASAYISALPGLTCCSELSFCLDFLLLNILVWGT